LVGFIFLDPNLSDVGHGIDGYRDRGGGESVDALILFAPSIELDMLEN
jgi:hypothetical protein